MLSTSTLLLASLVAAQAAAPAAPVTTSDRVEDTASLDEAPVRTTRLAVMKLKASGVPEEYAEGLTETIATAAAQTGVFETISPAQISALLSFEKRKELLGGCVEEECFVQVAQAVKAPHLVGGSIAKVGDQLVLNLVLIDAGEGSALKRTDRNTTSASQLMSSARAAMIVVLQPLLESRQGYLRVAVNVPDAGVTVDDERRVEGVGQVIALAAGPHALKVVRDGFYTTTADVFVRPGRVSVETVNLIPAKETIQSYEGSAKLKRWGGYGTAVVAVGAAVASGLFYARATDNKNMVDSYTSALGTDRAQVAYPDVVEARNDFNTNQAVYLSLLGTAVISAGVSAYLFLTGDDPDRYEEFHSLNGM